MNALLSKSDIALSEPELNEGNFIQKEIKEFYKNQDVIGHCYKDKK